MIILIVMFRGSMARFAGVVCLLLMFFIAPVSTIGSGPVISHLKTGETGFVSYEYVAIYNNSDKPIDVSGWCLQYSSVSDATKTKLACLEPDNANITLQLAPFSFARFSSNEFKNSVSDFMPDALFSAGISGTSGHLRLLDKDKNEVDKIGWGVAVSPEQHAVATHQTGLILSRKTIPDSSYLQDVNNNQQDFIESLLGTIPVSGIVEIEHTPDICPNIDGLQNELPDDYYNDESGDCIQDQCDNIAGLQVAVPDAYESFDGENCTEIILNLESSILNITELLPNASSVDDGKEFIELYNPNNKAINLEGYRLELGPTHTKSYTLKTQLLNPFSFAHFSDIITGLILPNSTSSVRLVAPSGDTVSETDVYENPKDDESWVLINGVWQFTKTPTPGAVNESTPDVEAQSGVDEELDDCAPGKYRNPETNRCRNIESGDVELKPCLPGQARNPDTNRCRALSVSSASLVPCKTGQERNPETNRCRNIISTASALKPCNPGQERNPETNRCRNSSTLGASTLADVQDVPAETKDSTNLWLVGVATLLAGSYGIYEWRSEIFSKLRFNRLKK